MKTLIISTIVTSLISVSGCSGVQPDPESQHMNRLGRRLLDLTMKIDRTLRADPAGTAELADHALVDRATARDPALRNEFTHYKVTTVRAGKVFSVLVCGEDGAHALLEDASCTVELDRKPWQGSPLPACQPALKLDTVCK